MAERRLAGAAALAVLLAALGALAASCGGGGGSPAAAGTTTSGTTTTAQAGAAAFRAYQGCLKAHGVTIVLPRRVGTPPAQGQTPPQVRTGTNGTRPRGAFGFANLTAAQRKAAEACRSKLPSGGQFRRVVTNPGGGAANGAFAKYTKCLSRHGVKFGASNQGSAAFRKAQAACRSLLPG